MGWTVSSIMLPLLTALVDQITRVFSTAQELTEEESRAVREPNHFERPPKRCGIPKRRDYKSDKGSLFLDKLHNFDDGPCDNITSLFVHESVYLAFFGKPDYAEEERLRLAEEERQRQRQADEEQQRQRD